MNRKRKQKLVDTHVQGALVRRIFLHWIAFFFVAGITLVMMKALIGNQELTVFERIKAQMGEFTLVSMVLLAIFPAFILDTIRFSNRFVGPIGRLRRHLRELGTEHKTEPCTFRDSDFWSGIADEFNKVSQLVIDQKQEIQRLKAQLTKSGVTSRE